MLFVHQRSLTKFDVGSEAAIPISCNVSAGNEMVSPVVVGDVADVVKT
jgi:hypothetical protein